MMLFARAFSLVKTNPKTRKPGEQALLDEALRRVCADRRFDGLTVGQAFDYGSRLELEVKHA